MGMFVCGQFCELNVFKNQGKSSKSSMAKSSLAHWFKTLSPMVEYNQRYLWDGYLGMKKKKKIRCLTHYHLMVLGPKY